MTGPELALDLVSLRLRLEDLRCYVNRGRPLQHLDQAELSERHTLLLRAWSATPLHPPRDLDDVQAEFYLRDEEPPTDATAMAQVRKQLAIERQTILPEPGDFAERLFEASASQDSARQLKQQERA